MVAPPVQIVLQIANHQVRGEVALVVPPGTVARDQDRLLDEALRVRLAELATRLGVVLGASPSSYAFSRPGRDAEGRIAFDVRGRIEGDQLVPDRARSR